MATDPHWPAAYHLLQMRLMVRDSGRHPEDDRAAIAATVFVQLTVQQQLVSVWMTAGFSNEEIAQHLGITLQELRVVFAEITQIARRMRP